MEKLISIIVPVYGTEKELPRCIESLQKQTYSNIEIILVDDGSKDNCGEICDTYAAQDSRIVVIHKQNAGIGEARNSGLDIARGELVTFSDSDDYVHPQWLELMHRALVENDADISICREQAFFDGENYECEQYESYTLEALKTAEEYAWFFMDEFLGPMGWVWNKLYKKEFLLDVRFESNRMIEGLMFNANIILKKPTYAWISERLYYYYQRGNSVTKNRHKLLEDRIYAETYVYDRLSGFGQEAFRTKYHTYYLSRLANCYALARRTKDAELMRTVREQFVAQYSKHNTKDVKMILFRHCPSLYCALKREKGV